MATGETMIVTATVMIVIMTADHYALKRVELAFDNLPCILGLGMIARRSCGYPLGFERLTADLLNSSVSGVRRLPRSSLDPRRHRQPAH
jgi:hypothetical protein